MTFELGNIIDDYEAEMRTILLETARQLTDLTDDFHNGVIDVDEYLEQIGWIRMYRLDRQRATAEKYGVT